MKDVHLGEAMQRMQTDHAQNRRGRERDAIHDKHQAEIAAIQQELRQHADWEKVQRQFDHEGVLWETRNMPTPRVTMAFGKTKRTYYPNPPPVSIPSPVAV